MSSLHNIAKIVQCYWKVNSFNFENCDPCLKSCLKLSQDTKLPPNPPSVFPLRCPGNKVTALLY